MAIANPFKLDATNATEDELAQLPPHGGRGISEFCGMSGASTNWDERGYCVLRARKGFGKSHLLKMRSLNHRSSAVANRTLFYPQVVGKPRAAVDTLSNLNMVVPRWLEGKDAVTPWMQIWQLSILGLLVWLTDARSSPLNGYSDWFGSLEELDKVHHDHQPDAPEGNQPALTLSMFMGRVLKRLEGLPTDDYMRGNNELKQALYHAGSDWAVAIAARLRQAKRQRIAMYLDAPDELVELNPPGLWRSVQQGMVLAIWKFSKSSNLNQLLNIYATVRSEAFGSEQDHPDLALALGLVMPLQYNSVALKAMLCDRIRQADPEKLSLNLRDGVDPVHALCGFGEVTHEDRDELGGGPYTEDIFESILRHTRHVPREVIAIAGAIYDMASERGYDTVRRTVNAEASQNIKWAISNSFLGWSDALHRRFAAKLRHEVIDGKTMAEIAGDFNEDGPKVIKFFVQHGLLGTAERVPQRHRHYYRQRFSFDEVHGHDDSISVNKDYFFLHPAFKEWIRSLSEQMTKTFEGLKVGAIGDLKPFEAMPPLIRLGVKDGKVFLTLRNQRRMSISEKGTNSAALQFLVVLLWARKTSRQEHVDIAELSKTWASLKTHDIFSNALYTYLPKDIHELVEMIKDWRRNISKDPDIRSLYKTLLEMNGLSITKQPNGKEKVAKPQPFLSLSMKSSLGASREMWFPYLPLDEFDATDAVYNLIKVKDGS